MNLRRMDIEEADAKYLIRHIYSPINYIFGYPKELKRTIDSALEKKLSGEEAHVYIDKRFFIDEEIDKI